jgi:pyruvate dehydrogenase complex dehydrogenase (E1) component
VAALSALAQQNVIDAAQVTKAIEFYGIDPGKPDPVTL